MTNCLWTRYSTRAKRKKPFHLPLRHTSTSCCSLVAVVLARQARPAPATERRFLLVGPPCCLLATFGPPCSLLATFGPPCSVLATFGPPCSWQHLFSFSSPHLAPEWSTPSPWIHDHWKTSCIQPFWRISLPNMHIWTLQIWSSGVPEKILQNVVQTRCS